MWEDELTHCRSYLRHILISALVAMLPYWLSKIHSSNAASTLCMTYLSLSCRMSGVPLSK